MPELNIDSAVLGKLQSEEQSELLDAIDQLRSEDFRHELTLPQLIVCGDQNSGKSSVLEAISRVQFPARSTFCTNFATELQLRRAPVGASPSIVVKIQPAESRVNKDEKDRVRDIKPKEALHSLEDLPKLIKDVGNQLKEIGPDRGIYEDRLLVTVRKPELPNLTLVDLPGIFHASDDAKREKDMPIVTKLVESYMANENSIILAVVSASNDFDLQEILKLARKFDDGGKRTLGIITKPDKVDAGDDLERKVIQYAMNLKCPLELGWHVLKNRSSSDESISADERDRCEMEFFAKSPATGWNALPEKHRGADALRTRLADVLLGTIGKSLPSIIRDINAGISAHERNLEKLGKPKMDDAEKREELREISVHLNKLVDAGIRGNYSSSAFFDSLTQTIQATRRLRANLRDIMDEFVDCMHNHGRLYEAAKEMPSLSNNGVPAFDLLGAHERAIHATNPESVLLSALLAAISLTIKESRGCEMDGLIPPAVISRIFHALSTKWDRIAEWYIERCLRAAAIFFKEAIHQSAPMHIAKRIIGGITATWFEDMQGQLAAKRKELLKPYRSTYLVTAKPLKLEAQEVESQHSTALRVHEYVEAYYKVALATFTENIAALAIENCLVNNLDAVFTFKTISTMDEDYVDALTKEPYDVARDRKRNQETLKILRGVLEICMKHVKSFDIPSQGSLFVGQNEGHITLDNGEAVSVTLETSPPQKEKSFCELFEAHSQDVPGYPSPPKTPAHLSPSVTPRRENRKRLVHRSTSSGRSPKQVESLSKLAYENHPSFRLQPEFGFPNTQSTAAESDEEL